MNSQGDIAIANRLLKEMLGLQREITAQNALIENIFTRNRIGFVTISYVEAGRNRIRNVRLVTLIVGNETRIIDQFGTPGSIRELKAGMIVNARFSAVMTRSNPPQSRASCIVIVKTSSSTLIEEGRVINVDEIGGFGYILTGNPRNPNRQMKYVVSKATKLRDNRGNRISLRRIRPGQIVRIERESFQTASIPPQTSAISVQIIS